MLQDRMQFGERGALTRQEEQSDDALPAAVALEVEEQLGSPTGGARTSCWFVPSRTVC